MNTDANDDIDDNDDKKDEGGRDGNNNNGDEDNDITTTTTKARMESEGLLPKIVSSMAPYVISASSILTSSSKAGDCTGNEGGEGDGVDGVVGDDNDKGTGGGGGADTTGGGGGDDDDQGKWVANFDDKQTSGRSDDVDVVDIEDPQLQQQQAQAWSNFQQQHLLPDSVQATKEPSTTTPPWYDTTIMKLFWLSCLSILMISLGVIFTPFLSGILFAVIVGLAVYYSYTEYIKYKNNNRTR